MDDGEVTVGISQTGQLTASSIMVGDEADGCWRGSGG